MTGFGKLSNNSPRDYGGDSPDDLGRIDPLTQIMDQQNELMHGEKDKERHAVVDVDPRFITKNILEKVHYLRKRQATVQPTR